MSPFSLPLRLIALTLETFSPMTFLGSDTQCRQRLPRKKKPPPMKLKPNTSRRVRSLTPPTYDIDVGGPIWNPHAPLFLDVNLWVLQFYAHLRPAKNAKNRAVM